MLVGKREAHETLADTKQTGPLGFFGRTEVGREVFTFSVSLENMQKKIIIKRLHQQHSGTNISLSKDGTPCWLDTRSLQRDLLGVERGSRETQLSTKAVSSVSFFLY